MGSVSTITPEWREWVAQNIRDGCSSESIVEVIVTRFDRPCVVNTGEEAVIKERTSWGTYFVLNENEFIFKLDRAYF